MSSPPPSGALEVLERMREAAITRSADDMSGVYAADAVHEFPFAPPGVPSRMEGRDGIMSFITAFWSASPLRYERYRTIAIHGTADPDTIIVEQEVEGISATTGPFVLPNVMVLTARHGRIAHVRDYASLPAVEAATASPLPRRLQHRAARDYFPPRTATVPPLVSSWLTLPFALASRPRTVVGHLPRPTDTSIQVLFVTARMLSPPGSTTR
jgi:ketosteroid isomerase-like protein